MNDKTKKSDDMQVNPASERYWPNFEVLSTTDLLEIQKVVVIVFCSDDRYHRTVIYQESNGAIDSYQIDMSDEKTIRISPVRNHQEVENAIDTAFGFLDAIERLGYKSVTTISNRKNSADIPMKVHYVYGPDDDMNQILLGYTLDADVKSKILKALESNPEDAFYIILPENCVCTREVIFNWEDIMQDADAA